MLRASPQFHGAPKTSYALRSIALKSPYSPKIADASRSNAPKNVGALRSGASKSVGGLRRVWALGSKVKSAEVLIDLLSLLALESKPFHIPAYQLQYIVAVHGYAYIYRSNVNNCSVSLDSPGYSWLSFTSMY